MPELDTDTQVALERVARDLAETPPVLTIEDRRRIVRQMAIAYGPAPAEVARVADCTIPGPRGHIPLRLYWPLDPAPTRPLLLHIHGGGWAIGDPDAYERVCRAYCAAGGCIVVDVHYRRAPENKYPAALQDCEAALNWMAEHAAALGGDPEHIVVAGDSAGGNLAAALCQRTRIPLALQVLVYPVMTARSDGHFPSRTALGDGRYFLREFDIKNAEREYLSDPQQGDEAGASPLSAPASEVGRLPPTLIITAEFDPLRDEGEAYARLLQSCGVPTDYRCTAATIHAFVLFAGLIEKGRAAIAYIGSTVRAGQAQGP